MNIFIDNKFDLNDKEIKSLESKGHQLLSEGTDDVHYWVTSPNECNENYMKYPNLKYIQLTSAGFDKLNLDELINRGIKVMNARGIFSPAIAEYIVSYILNIYKGHFHFKELQESSEWNKDTKLETINGKRVMFLGAGSIAQETAKFLKPFGAYTIGLNSNGRHVDPFDECLDLEGGLKLIGTADIVVCSLPSNEATYHLLDYDVLKKMNPASIFINIGRGDVLDEEGLLKVLDKTIRCAILDVFEHEPLAPESKLWKHPKVIVTPHISYSSPDRNLRHVALFMEQISRIEKGEEPMNLISQ